MKRIIVIAAVILCSCQGLQAQDIGSFFNQKKTQKKYYLEQIAALQLYAGYIKDGYKTVNGGLKLVQRSGKDESGLHETYYQSFWQVNDNTQNGNTAKEINRLAGIIRKTFRETITRLDTLKCMSVKDMKYIRSVRDNVERRLSTDLAELAELTTPGKLQLTDEERRKRMEHVLAEVEDKHAFTLSFTKKTLFVAEQRKRELLDIERMKKLHNIKD